ncbi:hypothetical protein PO124_15335 [Bacillus licheniformis]|nr:hypothetical protein [Bacillus licheniformis]
MGTKIAGETPIITHRTCMRRLKRRLPGMEAVRSNNAAGGCGYVPFDPFDVTKYGRKRLSAD